VPHARPDRQRRVYEAPPGAKTGRARTHRSILHNTGKDFRNSLNSALPHAATTSFKPALSCVRPD
jgi:hypothetical protein